MEVIMLNCENYIVLFSGGIDSTYMLLNLLQETKKAQINPNIICLYINYGQRCYCGEFKCAQEICNRLNIELKVVSVPDLYNVINYKNALLDEHLKTAEIVQNQGSNTIELQINLIQDNTELLYRNNFFVMFASMLGKQEFNNQPFHILLGAIAGGDFKDCSEEFVLNMNNILKHQCPQARLEAPLLRFDKLHVIDALKASDKFKLIGKTWSCYESSTAEECGKCYNCLSKQALGVNI